MGMDQDIAIKVGDLELAGTLAFPPKARGLVMFAHRSRLKLAGAIAR
jgi:hypothetical protein